MARHTMAGENTRRECIGGKNECIRARSCVEVPSAGAAVHTKQQPRAAPPSNRIRRSVTDDSPNAIVLPEAST